MGQLRIWKKGNLAREGLGLVRTQKRKKKKAEGTHPLERDCPGHAKKGASKGESVAMMVVIWCIQTVREGQIREKKQWPLTGWCGNRGVARFVWAVRDSQNREKIRATYWAVWQWG